MFGLGKQKFCDYCNMPVEMCECDNCENCGKAPSKCKCEVCADCNNFVEYCECEGAVDSPEEEMYNRKDAPPSSKGAGVCVDCGFHFNDCICDEVEGQEGEDDSEDEPYEEDEEREPELEVVYVEKEPTKGDKIWRYFITAIIGLSVVAVVWLCYFVYVNLFQEVEEEFLSPTEKYEASQELLTLMYNVRDVQDVINNQDAIMSKVSPQLYPNFDVSNENLYLNRYGAFSNSEISVSFNSYTKSKGDNQIVVNYTVTPQADFPVTRMAVIEFGEDNQILHFTEYNVNKIE